MLGSGDSTFRSPLCQKDGAVLIAEKMREVEKREKERARPLLLSVDRNARNAGQRDHIKKRH